MAVYANRIRSAERTIKTWPRQTHTFGIKAVVVFVFVVGIVAVDDVVSPSVVVVVIIVAVLLLLDGRKIAVWGRSYNARSRILLRVCVCARVCVSAHKRVFLYILRSCEFVVYTLCPRITSFY